MMRGWSVEGTRGDTVVFNWNTNTHRLFARQFLGDFSRQAGDAADDEDETAKHGWKPHVVEHRRKRAVDVDRQWLHDTGDGAFHRLDECDAISRNAAAAREIEQDVCARVGLVHAMAESRP